MTQSRRRVQVIIFFALLLAVDSFLYFRHAGHFFQGDTIFLLDHRAVSVRDYFKEFIALNPSGWYRPLANELIESVLYPVAGLHPVPYRIPVYAVFIGITAGVYALALALTRRHLAAALAAFFFTIHTTNSYTTYDVGFMPELLYALFYVVATLAYLRYLDHKNKTAYSLSLICFVAALLSKEAAVTLPATLFAAGILFTGASQSFRERLLWTLRSIVPHMIILVAYLAFAVGYLNVMGVSISRLFDRSQVPNPGDYIPVLNGGIFKNADLALTWAFNIPRAWWGQWQHLSAPMLLYLKFFRALVFALIAVLLIRSERKPVLFGSAWFWITVLPALPLVTHFIPYYLFVPAIGLSIVVGAAFVWLYDFMSRIQNSIAAALIVVIFAGVLYVTSRSIRADIENSRLLGGSARLAFNTLSDLRSLYPALPAGATLYFLDEKEQLAWEHDLGGLIKTAYGTDKISVLYESQHDSVDPDIQDVMVFAVHHGRLSDETANYRKNPAIFMKFLNSDLKLELSAAEVTVGDRYTLTIKSLSRTPVRIAYTIDRGPLETFSAALDNDGKVTFDISPQTRKGIYKFLAFNVSGTNDWVRAERTLTVR